MVQTGAKNYLKTQKTTKKPSWKRNWWVAASLAGVMLLVLFFTSFFNATSGVAINPDGETLGEKFYFSGPDPYYHARVVEKISETGHHPYWTQDNTDPLLNYPVGRINPRPPVFDWTMAVFGKMLTPFVGNEIDALGYAMQLTPAIFGALLALPIYFLAFELFGDRKIGVIAALLMAITPIHLGSGHGSAYTLADHDSFVLFFSTLTFLFLVKAIKALNEKKYVGSWKSISSIAKGKVEFMKQNSRALLFAALSGVSLSVIGLSWEGFQVPAAIVAAYCIIQMFVDHWRNKDPMGTFFVGFVVLAIALAMTSPYYALRGSISMVYMILFMLAGVVAAGLILMPTRDLPSVIVLPATLVAGGIALGLLAVVRAFFADVVALKPLVSIANTLFGGIAYVQLSKVYMTIAEASTADMSTTVMSFGPVTFFLAWIGIFALIYRLFKKAERKVLLVLIWMGVSVYLTLSAGRFMNELVPMFCIMAAWIIGWMINKVDFPKMVKTIKGAGGMRGVKRGLKAGHVMLALFLSLCILLPNTWMAVDAAVPYEKKTSGGAFGLGLYKEKYWVDACSWLAEQDTHLAPAERPGFISWWDYGFYESFVGKHPAVADNFQDGIEPAGNFITATSETEGIAVIIVRILEGHYVKEGALSQETESIISKYLGADAVNFTAWIKDPKLAPSYNAPIAPEYDEKLSLGFSVSAANARYRDCAPLVTKLGDEKVTDMYRELQDSTGYSIRYYGVEGYDLQIFNVFTFLSDKSNVLKGADEDEFLMIKYVDAYGKSYTMDQIKSMSPEAQRNLQIVDSKLEYKPAFFQTMVYQAYVGIPSTDGSMPTYSIPTYGMKHWVPAYVSPYPSQYQQGMSAVVIAKYYEGATVKGTLTVQGIPMPNVQAVVIDATEYGLPHDMTMTDENGQFSLIAPAGAIKVRFFSGETEIGGITFDGSGEYAPITEEEATRRAADYAREVSLSLELADVTGRVYEDLDGDGSYDAQKDAAIEGAKVYWEGMNVTTDANGVYEFDGILPGSMTLSVTKEGYEPKSVQVGAIPGETTVMNITVSPAAAKVTGAVWYDADGNGAMNEDETLPGVYSIKFMEGSTQKASAYSNATGYYTANLKPGTYVVEVMMTSPEYGELVFNGSLKIVFGTTEKVFDIKMVNA